MTLIASDSGTFANDLEVDLTASAMQDALSAFNKPDLSVLDIGLGCEARLQFAIGKRWKCFGVDPAIAEDALITRPITEAAAFVVRRIEDLVPHAFDLIFIADLPDEEHAAATLFFKLFSIGAITPATQVIGGVDQPTARTGWSRLTFFKKLHFIEIGQLRLGATELQSGTDRPAAEIGLRNDAHSTTKHWLQAGGSDFASFMQERYVPGTWSKLAEYEHMPRYALAHGYAPGKAVLDFGCGTGYGAAILAGTAGDVIGLDIDDAAIEWARGTHRSDRLKFHQCTDLGASLPEASFDLVTCFEMIEHVDFATQQATIASIARLLKSDGMLLISTPNPAVTQLYGENPYHLREMTLPEFHELLGPHFDHIEILQQRVLNSVTFESLGSSPNNFEAGKISPALAAVPLAFIAICAKRKLPLSPASVFFDEETDFILETLQKARGENFGKMAIYTLQEQLQNARASTNHVNDVLHDAAENFKAKVVHQESEAAIREVILREKTLELAARDAAIASLDEQLRSASESLERVNIALCQATENLSKSNAQQERDVAVRDALLSEKDGNLIAREATIAALNQAIGRLASRITDQDTVLSEKVDDLLIRDATIAALNETIGQLTSRIIDQDAMLIEKEQEKSIAKSSYEHDIAAADHRMVFAQQEYARALSVRDNLLTANDDILIRRAEEVGLLQHQIVEQDVEIQELALLKSSKWQRLHGALKARPVTLRNAVKSAYLVGAMVSPNWLRKRLGPSIHSLRVKRGAVKVANQAKANAESSDLLLSDLTQGEVSEPEPIVSLTAIGSVSSLPAYAVNVPEALQGHRPRVIHVIANFCVGGSSRLVIDLIECLGGEYEQFVLTSYIPAPPDYTGVQIVEYAGLPETSQFISYFLEKDPDFVHVHYWGDCDASWYSRAISAAEQLGIPIIENVNTPVEPHFSAGIAQYIYVSRFVQETFGRVGAGHQTIFPGSDFKRFNKSSDLIIPDDCIGMVYRLETDKLNASAILPFIEVVKNRPATRVLIVGGGSLLDTFIEATKRSGVFGSFEFAGYVPYDMLPNYYRRMSLFVAPVWKESFGQVSAFAMNMHIPVCGFDVGAISEIIDEPDLVAPAGDAHALAQVICALLDDRLRRESLGLKMHRRAQDLFSQRAMIDAYAGIYKNVFESFSR